MRILILGAALSALATGTLAAQDAATGDGLWYGGGLGPGVAFVSCHICRADRGTAATGTLRLGGRVKAGVLIGAEATLWAGGVQSGVHESMWGLAAAGYFFPRPRGTFYLKAGLGILNWHSEDGQTVLSAGSVAGLLGLGWEFRIARQVTLAPYLSVFAAPIAGDIKYNGGAAQSGAGLVLAQLGVSITKH